MKAVIYGKIEKNKNRKKLIGKEDLTGILSCFVLFLFLSLLFDHTAAGKKQE